MDQSAYPRYNLVAVERRVGNAPGSVRIARPGQFDCRPSQEVIDPSAEGSSAFPQPMALKPTYD